MTTTPGDDGDDDEYIKWQFGPDNKNVFYDYWATHYYYYYYFYTHTHTTFLPFLCNIYCSGGSPYERPVGSRPPPVFVVPIKTS